ncbi:MAG TPA: hypothetical protein VM492_18265 [Sumerlaeia bacterium]|nr:hypothetical protein [Sumerlaeia bacterium]
MAETAPSRGLDRRWIFLSIGLVVLIFLRLPVKLKYAPNEKTRGVYDAVETLEPGTIVYISADYGPSTRAELLPMHEAIVYHALKRDLRIVSGALWPDGPPLIDLVFGKIKAELAEEGVQKEYGADFVNLGYKAGGDVTIVKIGSSIPETFPVDYNDTPLASLPLMQEVKNFDQIGLLVDISAGSPGVREWLQQAQKRFQIRLVAGVTAVMAPDLYAYFQSKQIEGFLGGLAGAAEYEYLLGRLEGRAMTGMNVQSVAHFVILGFILFGNVLYYRQWRRSRLER